MTDMSMRSLPRCPGGAGAPCCLLVTAGWQAGRRWHALLPRCIVGRHDGQACASCAVQQPCNSPGRGQSILRPQDPGPQESAFAFLTQHLPARPLQWDSAHRQLQNGVLQSPWQQQPCQKALRTEGPPEPHPCPQGPQWAALRPPATASCPSGGLPGGKCSVRNSWQLSVHGCVQM